MAQVKRKKILIHTLIFPPDQVSTAYLYGDLCKGFLAKGWKVDVFTTEPHYNYNAEYNHVDFRKFFFGYKSNYAGANVTHIFQRKSKNPFIRGLYIALFHFLFLLKGIFGPKYDVILTPSPPLTSGWLSAIVAKIKGSKSIYNVQEIYPDILFPGKEKVGVIYKLLKWIESSTYKYSTVITTIDQAFYNKLVHRLNETEKLLIIPNFVDVDLYKPLENPKYDEHLSFDGKYLIGYVGNLGKVQDWDTIFEAASKLESIDNTIHFLLVGGGAEYDRLFSLSKKLSNVHVWPYQNRELVPLINNRCDLHIISMNQASNMDGLPSKIYTILACGKPILAGASDDSPIAGVLKMSGNSVVVPMGNSDEFIKAIKGIKSSEINLSPIQGIEFVTQNYSREKVVSMYLDLIDSIV